MTKDLTVILPTYNERENIVRLISEILKKVGPRAVIIVDDQSPDGTASLVRTTFNTIPLVRCMENSRILGLARSIEAGIRAAKTTYVAWMDADFSHPPEILNAMYQKIPTHDIIVASWLIKRGKDYRPEWLAVFCSKLINRLCQYCFKSRITCYTSGFIMAKRSIFDTITFWGEYGEYCIDLLVRSVRMGYRVAEVAFTCQPRASGESKTAINLWGYILRSRKYLASVVRLMYS